MREFLFYFGIYLALCGCTTIGYFVRGLVEMAKGGEG